MKHGPILLLLSIAAILIATVSRLGVSAAREEKQAPRAELDWVALKPACFQMGDARIYREEMPVREVCLEGFEITRTEITVAQFADFVEATGYQTRPERGWTASDPNGPGEDIPPGGAVFQPRDDRPAVNLNWWRWVEGANWRQPQGPTSGKPDRDHPVTQITQADAAAFAAWAGGRLPTEAEWEYAARGGLDGALFAWEEAEQAALKAKANTWQGIFPISNTIEDGYEGIAPVASYPENGFGLHDMIGNVWEWTATPFTPSHSERDRARAGTRGRDPAQPGIAVGTIKGGSYLCAASYCYRFRPAARQAQDLAYGTSHIGFRIVRPISQVAE